MADEKYTIPDNPQYKISDIRKLQDTDPASATQTFNPVIEPILESVEYLNQNKAGLDENGKVPENQLPEMDYVPTNEKGKPSGVATLGADGKVPSAQLPSMNFDAAGAAATVQQNLNSHTGNKSNPHGVTAAQVGALPANGTAAAANKLATPRAFRTDLGSTAAPDFDGTKNVTPGVTGVLPVANGGTGVTSLKGLVEKLRPLIFNADPILNNNTWEQIHAISSMGLGPAIWSVGDTKAILISGIVGTSRSQSTVSSAYVFILGFDHNSAIEGTGITFGCFKTSQTGGKDVCLVDDHYNSAASDTSKWFNMNHSSSYQTQNGWKGCDMRYDILGSTRSKNVDAAVTTVTAPVANTLMAALPSDLRAVMQPMTKYTDNVGNGANSESNITKTIDYLPLLSEVEVNGRTDDCNSAEANYQKQYSYFSSGNSKIKKKLSDPNSDSNWWLRSPYKGVSGHFCFTNTNGAVAGMPSNRSQGISPIFKV